MKKIYYPENFVSMVRTLYPNHTRLHELLDDDSPDAGYMIRDILRQRKIEWTSCQIEIEKLTEALIVCLRAFVTAGEPWEELMNYPDAEHTGYQKSIYY